jgi:hypothetical protein
MNMQSLMLSNRSNFFAQQAAKIPLCYWRKIIGKWNKNNVEKISNLFVIHVHSLKVKFWYIILEFTVKFKFSKRGIKLDV